MPAIKGGEYYSVFNGADEFVDGPTIPMHSSGGRTVQRIDPCLPPDVATSWTVSTWSLATSGSGAGEGCARGVVINEFTDPLGSGNFNYEFVELYYDN